MPLHGVGSIGGSTGHAVRTGGPASNSVTTPPAQVVAPEAEAVFTRPAGYVSVNAAAVTAIVFGVATDYSVFLLSRIKEARDSGIPNGRAVAVSLERTGRIVTAAALLFAVAIGAFATSKLVFIKELGLGTALAVLIDASVIRALLVPSLMELLGEWNWWAPAPLRRLHDRIGRSEHRPRALPTPEPSRASRASRA